jgi:hypothetical protein
MSDIEEDLRIPLLFAQTCYCICLLCYRIIDDTGHGFPKRLSCIDYFLLTTAYRHSPPRTRTSFSIIVDNTVPAKKIHNLRYFHNTCRESQASFLRSRNPQRQPKATAKGVMKNERSSITLAIAETKHSERMDSHTRA